LYFGSAVAELPDGPVWPASARGRRDGRSLELVPAAKADDRSPERVALSQCEEQSGRSLAARMAPWARQFQQSDRRTQWGQGPQSSRDAPTGTIPLRQTANPDRHAPFALQPGRANPDRHAPFALQPGRANPDRHASPALQPGRANPDRHARLAQPGRAI